MKPPNQKKCTIAEMVEWAAQMNGKVRKGRKASMIAWILANIEVLNKLQKLPWSSRNWAMTAMRDIERIGVYDTLSLVHLRHPSTASHRPLFASVRSAKPLACISTRSTGGLSSHVSNLQQPPNQSWYPIFRLNAVARHRLSLVWKST